jgi:1,4-dihydroxy-2-naphthoyl-CoA hydrolase
MYCGDNLMISLLAEKIGLDKFEITYEMIIDEVIVARAITRHVCIDASSKMKQELPDYMNNWLTTNHRDAEGAERRKSREDVM